MKHYLWVLCLLLSTRAGAQIKVTNLTYSKAVNISPLALVDQDNTAMAGGEYRFKNNLSVLADVGYVFHSSYIEEAKKTRGFSIRPAMRLYLGREHRKYVQLQASYKQANYTVHDWLGKESVNGVPAYFELQDFTYRKQVSTLSLMMGRMILLGSDDWFADVWVGLGLRYRKLGITGEENATYELNRGLWWPPDERLLTLHLPFSIRVAHTFE
jgi:hypothetical protein